MKEFDIFGLSLSVFDTVKGGLQIDKKPAKKLLQALTGHSKLAKLTLVGSQIGTSGQSTYFLGDTYKGVDCAEFAVLFQNPESKLASFSLEVNDTLDEDAATLAEILTGNSSLKDLDLSWNPSITNRGWWSIFTVVQSPSCTLEKLSLRGCFISDAAACSLSGALTNCSSLKSLNLSR